MYGTQIRSSIESGSSIGRKLSVCGQMGVMSRAGISGWTSEPPAESWVKRTEEHRQEDCK